MIVLVLYEITTMHYDKIPKRFNGFSWLIYFCFLQFNFHGMHSNTTKLIASIIHLSLSVMMLRLQKQFWQYYVRCLMIQPILVIHKHLYFWGAKNIYFQTMATSITTLVEEMPLAHVVDSKFVDKVCAHCMIPIWER